MREIRTSGSEGGVVLITSSLPLSKARFMESAHLQKSDVNRGREPDRAPTLARSFV